MTNTLSSKATPHGSSTSGPDAKHRALKQLNAKYQPLRSAVNLIQANADRASRQIDEEYNRERQAIINARDENDWEFRT